MFVYQKVESIIWRCAQKIKFGLFKNYAVDAYKNSLRGINCPNYGCFEDINRAYSDFFQKLMIIINNAAPYKTKRVKGNSQNWFDGEVLEKLRPIDKLFKVFKKTRLHINKELSERLNTMQKS